MVGPVETVRAALEAGGFKPRERGGKWVARCPVHGGDDGDSLELTEGGDGRALVCCQSKGCGFADIMDALGLAPADAFPEKSGPRPVPASKGSPGRVVASYAFVDENGRVLCHEDRFEPKDFRPRRPDGRRTMEGVRRVPYNLDRIDAAPPGSTIWWVEGPKDADRLSDLGLLATTSIGGAGQAEKAELGPVKGHHLIIVTDNDDSGRKYGETIARKAVEAGAAEVRILEIPNLPPKGDVSDYLDAGGTKQGLMKLAVVAPAWRQEIDTKRVGFILRELIDRPELTQPPPAMVHGFIYEDRLTVLAGLQKLGKSTLMGYLAAALSHHVKVIWCGLEEPLGDPVRRFVEFGANPDNILVIDRITEHADLFSEIDRFEPAMVFIDTLAKWGEGHVTDWHSSAQVTPIMSALADLCHHSRVAVFVSHHARKSDGKFRDSTAIAAGCDLMVEMHGDESDRFVRRFEPVGRMSLEPFALRFTGSAYEVVGGHVSIRDRVLALVEAEPGISKRRVRDSIVGTNSVIDEGLALLVRDGLVEDRGDDRGSKYHVTEKGTGTVAARCAARSNENGKTQYGTVSARYRHGDRHARAADPSIYLRHGVPARSAQDTGEAVEHAF